MIELKKHTVSIAPMMERTHKHFRFFMRLITKHTVLYTEMVPAETIHFGKQEKFLGFNKGENPLVLQVGGSNPKYLAETAILGQNYGYDEINLNVGCPSDRVQSGSFGACLMNTPEKVAELCHAMMSNTNLPITVKHRIGIDGKETYEDMLHFVDTVSAVGVKRFNVHARIAILSGLSPKENRTIPPLRYEDVYRLKKERPNLIIEINGGINSLEEVNNHLQFVDGAMIGRAAWDNPWIFKDVDKLFFNDEQNYPDRIDILNKYQNYIDNMLVEGHPISILLQPIFNIFNGVKGARHWRRYLTENGIQKKSDPNIINNALKLMNLFVTDLN